MVQKENKGSLDKCVGLDQVHYPKFFYEVFILVITRCFYDLQMNCSISWCSSCMCRNCRQHAFTLGFNWLKHSTCTDLGSQTEINCRSIGSWWTAFSAGEHPHMDAGSICLSWLWVGVDGIHLDLSVLPPPPQMLLFLLCLLAAPQFTVTLLLRASQLKSAGEFWLSLAVARASQTILANKQCSVTRRGLFGKTLKLWILNREGLLQT